VAQRRGSHLLTGPIAEFRRKRGALDSGATQGSARELERVSGILTLDREAIGSLCQRHGVVRLAIFGSALTDRFDPARSDVDLAVEFSDGLTDRFAAYFGLKEDLEALFGRPVDLVVRAAIANPFFAAEVTRTEETLFAA
jgi:uncharacterized protein